MCVCVCLYVYSIHACMCRYKSTYPHREQRATLGILRQALRQLFETVSHCLGPHHLNWAGWPVSHRNTPVPAPWNWTYKCLTVLYVDSGDQTQLYILPSTYHLS